MKLPPRRRKGARVEARPGAGASKRTPLGVPALDLDVGTPKPTATVRVELADAIVLGPGDRLIVRMKPEDEHTHELAEDLALALGESGIRSLVICGDVEFAVEKADPADGFA